MGSRLASLPAATREAVEPWLHPNAAHVQDLRWDSLVRFFFARWPEAASASASGSDSAASNSAASELAQLALQTLQDYGVPTTVKATGAAQELGAWFLDMCYTELNVRARRLRATVEYTVVPNSLYGLMRPHVPSNLQCLTDEHLGNLAEAAGSCMLLRQPVPDWAGIRALLASVAQLDDDLLRAAVAWTPPVPDQVPLVATSGDAVAMQAPTGGTSGK
jgi:hypothetical protein